MNGQEKPQPPAAAARRTGRGADRTAVAILLSGLVLPGLGQLYLKRYRRGAIILALLAVGFFILVSEAVRDTLELTASLEGYEEILDLQTAVNLAAETFSPDSRVYAGCLLYIAALWLFSIADAWRIGKKQRNSTSGMPLGGPPAAAGSDRGSHGD